MSDEIKGYKAYRLEDASNELEIAFSKAWEDENKSSDFLCRLVSAKPNGIDYELTERDEKIAATIIQWLGTSAGQGFISKVTAK